jgi:glucose 1-dehydrogenase
MQKTAIVTGAGQGIGYAIALQLGSQGYALVANDLDAQLLQKLKEKLALQNTTCITVAGDCGSIYTIQNIVNQAVSTFGGIDVVVANAGITTFGRFLDYEPTHLQNLYQTNIFGTFFLLQKTAQIMLQQCKPGSLIIMSSVTAHTSHENLAAYGMTKAALEQLAKNLTLELAPHQIRVNCIAPGITATERTLQDSQYMAVWPTINPMKKVATVHDIAQAVSFFADRAQSGHITGQTLVIDGGWHLAATSPYN